MGIFGTKRASSPVNSAAAVAAPSSLPPSVPSSSSSSSSSVIPRRRYRPHKNRLRIPSMTSIGSRSSTCTAPSNSSSHASSNKTTNSSHSETYEPPSIAAAGVAAAETTASVAEDYANTVATLEPKICQRIDAANKNNITTSPKSVIPVEEEQVDNAPLKIRRQSTASSLASSTMISVTTERSSHSIENTYDFQVDDDDDEQLLTASVESYLLLHNGVGPAPPPPPSPPPQQVQPKYVVDDELDDTVISSISGHGCGGDYHYYYEPTNTTSYPSHPLTSTKTGKDDVSNEVQRKEDVTERTSKITEGVHEDGTSCYTCFEVEYDSDRFASSCSAPHSPVAAAAAADATRRTAVSATKVLATVSHGVTSFGHRVQSFRHDFKNANNHRGSTTIPSAAATSTATSAQNKKKKISLGRSRNASRHNTNKSHSNHNSLMGQQILEYHDKKKNGEDTTDDEDMLTLSTVSSGTNSGGMGGEDGTTAVQDDQGTISSFFSRWTRTHHKSTKYDDINRIKCTDHAKVQYKVWKRASIEGSHSIRITAVLMTVWISVLLVSILVFCDYFPWTVSSIVSCLYLLVGAFLILLFETRSHVIRFPQNTRSFDCCFPAGWRNCWRTANPNTDDDDTDTDTEYRSSNDDDGTSATPAGISASGDFGTGATGTVPSDNDSTLPMDVYRRYGGDPKLSPEQRKRIVFGAKSRDDVMKSFNALRYVYGRGGLYLFTGSMTIAMIPYVPPNFAWAYLPILLLYVPSTILIVLGLVAFLVGVHAVFRWTLLDTSIHCNNQHLFEKFMSAQNCDTKNRNNNDYDDRDYYNDGEDEEDDDDEESGVSHGWRKKNARANRLDRDEFSILVMSLGLDLDETTTIPEIFTQEIRVKNPEYITFVEFRSWWRGGCNTTTTGTIDSSGSGVVGSGSDSNERRTSNKDSGDNGTNSKSGRNEMRPSNDYYDAESSTKKFRILGLAPSPPTGQ